MTTSEAIRAEEAFEAAFPGVECNLAVDEICTWWGDFRQNRYESGTFVIAKYAMLESSASVFNGTETTRVYQAIKDGVPGRFIRTTFDPDFGHANYGDARFEPA